MARLGRKNSQDTPETEVPEVTEEAVTEEAADDFDSFMKSGDLNLDLPEQSSSNDAPAIHEEEETEMAKHDSTATIEATIEAPEVESNSTPVEADPTEAILSDASKQVMENASSKAVEMKSIDSIPGTLIHVKLNLQGLDALGQVIKDETEAFRAGTSDKDAKVKYAIEHMDSADANYQKRESVAELKRQIEELTAKLDEDETKLYEEVEKALTANGEEVWSDEKIEEKQNYIRDLHSNYATTYKATAQIMEAHNKVKPQDELGAIEQYVNKVDRPFSRGRGSGSSATAATGSRNIFVSVAELSTDGGTTWKKIENSRGASNVAVLAAELARTSKDSANELKDRIYTNYYAESGFTFETATNENMPEVSDFDVVHVAKSSGEYETVKVRLTKRFRADA